MLIKMEFKNLNLKVTETLFYEFHRLKGALKAGTNQDCLHKLMIIADRMIEEYSESIEEKDQFLKSLEEHFLIA